ncbi:MAG: efflux RND transporter permease subunit [Acidobacteriaceae bacterium]|nr:efflux RND transporter permease subunit [Acidobacteriaceae bacterium]
MWIVKLAIDRPYTFVVAAILILFLGTAAIINTPTDIFPNIDIPVISVIWTYTGLPAEEVEKRITVYSEFVMAIVNDIRSIESQSLNGVATLKIYFNPQVRVDAATAQVGAAVQAIQFHLPPGIHPPWVLRFGASTVPIIQLALSSKVLNEAALYDYGLFRVRTQLSTVPGVLLPAPYGGKQRQIMVDLDQNKLLSKGLTPIDVNNAIQAQDVTLPSGQLKIGRREYTVSTNSSPPDALQLNNVPVKYVNGTVVYMRDIGNVRDGYAVQQEAVRANGLPACLLTIMKLGSVSTLEIIDHIKNKVLPITRAAAPKGLDINPLFDQSIFVRGSVQGVLREGLIAAGLTAGMILLFLGSWRSTLIIAVSIPLSILCSIIALSATNNTLNVMTLGGLALAIGILVDDATVTIENIHRHMGRKTLRDAVLDGASQIAVPTFVSTLTICIVFVSVVFLTGPAKYLFTPMALAVVFAMVASYLLSRTLVPVMSNYLLKGEQQEVDPETGVNVRSEAQGTFERFHHRFDEAYVRIRTRYTAVLTRFVGNPRLAFTIAGAIMATPFLLLPFVGRDFFPDVDAGQMRLHVRAQPGMRLEETKIIFSRVEQEIRRIIPPEELDLVLDDIGVPPDSFNLAFGDGATIGAFDGQILLSLKEDHRPVRHYIAEMRKRLPPVFPDLTFYFQPADMVSQILNFGLPAPIDIQIQGFNPANYTIAKQIRRRISGIPGIVDAHVHQVLNGPDLHFDVDRIKAAEFGLTQLDVANNLNIALSSSAQVYPNFWMDPKMGITYLVAAQTPQYVLNSVNAVENTPILTRIGNGQPQILSNLTQMTHQIRPIVANHHNVQPVFDVFANVQNADLGSVASEVDKVASQFSGKLAPGNLITVLGQVQSMQEAFRRLGLGLIFAAVLVYLLMVVNFQSWTDPFIIITALPGAFCGIIWALFLTQTTLSVPSLMGAIMSIGVATANSILLVTFANDRVELGRTAKQAAIDAGCTRLRPIVMTALAMIIGMLPMSLGLGEGGEQNAPLARAVIGGLSLATFATLFFVPLMFSAIHSRRDAAREESR